MIYIIISLILSFVFVTRTMTYTVWCRPFEKLSRPEL